MTDRLREAARAVLATRVGFEGDSPITDGALVADSALSGLRAALDAEPEPSRTNEERARELARDIVRQAALAPESSGMWIELEDAVTIQQRNALAAAEARGLERGERQAMLQLKPVTDSKWEDGWNAACRCIAAAIRALGSDDD